MLYQRSVQNVEAEIDFVDDVYKELRGRKARVLREDFCGTALTCCEWVKRRGSNRAIGVDLCAETQEWGRKHNFSKIKPNARRRIRLLNENVLTVKAEAPDIVLAMNFSYFIFDTRDMMRRYFKHVRETLRDGGMFFLDCYGGWESFKPCRDKRKIDKNLTYIWDQHEYDPISGKMTCYIHFHFADGSKINRAFVYHWRMWTLPELREILAEAGFARSTVYWEGWDEKANEGDGEFEPASSAEQDPSWICYIVAEK